MTSSLGCLAGFKPIREALGVSVADIAARLAIKPTSYRRYERGERNMYLHQAVAVANMLGVTVDQLIREPTIDDLIALTNRQLEAQRPAQAPDLLQRPVFTTGGGLTRTSRPYSDAELRARNLDPALYVPGPVSDEHQPEMEAMAAAGASMGESEVDPAWQARYDAQQPVESPEEDKWRLDRMLEEVGLSGGVDD